MHDFLISLVFVAMVASPAVVLAAPGFLQDKDR
jgi:hypothetical protein